MDPDAKIGKIIPNTGGLKLVSIIGNGSFATVFKAVGKDNSVYAVKWLSKLNMSEREKSLQKDEVMYMKVLGHHKNIIKLHDVIETYDSLYIILEMCKTDLYELITQGDGLSMATIKRYFNEICDGVKHCHNNHIFHRDLKPENILLSEDDCCKLSDFGLCCFEEWTSEFNCGSLRYMAPECIDKDSKDDDDDDDDDYFDDEDDIDDEDDRYLNNNYYNHPTKKPYPTECNSKQSDIWALGVILINMIFGQNPWSSADMYNPTYETFIKKDPDVLQKKLGLSDEFNEVVKRMFSKHISERYTLEELRAEVNKIKVFSDYSKRVEDYLGVDDDLIMIANEASRAAKESEEEEEEEGERKAYAYHDWYDDEEEEEEEDMNDYRFNRRRNQSNGVVVPDIDSIDMEEEEEDDTYTAVPTKTNNTSSLIKPMDWTFKVPTIGQWGEDVDEDDDEEEEEEEENDENEKEESEEEEEANERSTYPMKIAMPWSHHLNENSYHHSPSNFAHFKPEVSSKIDFNSKGKSFSAWESEEESEEDEREKEEEEMFRRRQNGDLLSTPKGLSKKKSVQLRWEDLFDSDDDNKPLDTMTRTGSNSSNVSSDTQYSSDTITEEDVRNANSITTTSSTLNNEEIKTNNTMYQWSFPKNLKWGDMCEEEDDEEEEEEEEKDEGDEEVENVSTKEEMNSLEKEDTQKIQSFEVTKSSDKATKVNEQNHSTSTTTTISGTMSEKSKLIYSAVPSSVKKNNYSNNDAIIPGKPTSSYGYMSKYMNKNSMNPTTPSTTNVIDSEITTVYPLSSTHKNEYVKEMSFKKISVPAFTSYSHSLPEKTSQLMLNSTKDGKIQNELKETHELLPSTSQTKQSINSLNYKNDATTNNSNHLSKANNLFISSNIQTNDASTLLTHSNINNYSLTTTLQKQPKYQEKKIQQQLPLQQQQQQQISLVNHQKRKETNNSSILNTNTSNINLTNLMTTSATTTTEPTTITTITTTTTNTKLNNLTKTNTRTTTKITGLQDNSSLLPPKSDLSSTHRHSNYEKGISNDLIRDHQRQPSSSSHSNLSVQLDWEDLFSHEKEQEKDRIINSDNQSEDNRSNSSRSCTKTSSTNSTLINNYESEMTNTLNPKVKTNLCDDDDEDDEEKKYTISDCRKGLSIKGEKHKDLCCTTTQEKRIDSAVSMMDTSFIPRN